MTMRPNEFPETMWSACNEAQRKWVVANWNGWYGDDVRLALVDGRDVTPPPLIGGLPAAIVAESPSQDSTYDVLDPEAAPAVVPPVAIDVAQVGEGVTEVFTAEPVADPVAEAEAEWDGGRTLWGEPVAAVVLETVDATTLVTPLPAEVRLQSWAAEVEAEAEAATQEDAPVFEPVSDDVLMRAVADAVISMDEREPTQEVARAAETFPPANEAAEAPASLSDDAGPPPGPFSGPGWGMVAGPWVVSTAGGYRRHTDDGNAVAWVEPRGDGNWTWRVFDREGIDPTCFSASGEADRSLTEWCHFDLAETSGEVIRLMLAESSREPDIDDEGGPAEDDRKLLRWVGEHQQSFGDEGLEDPTGHALVRRAASLPRSAQMGSIAAAITRRGEGWEWYATTTSFTMKHTGMADTPEACIAAAEWALVSEGWWLEETPDLDVLTRWVISTSAPQREPAYVERGFLHCDTPGGIRMALPFADVLGWASGSTQGTNDDGVGCLLVVRGEALGVAIVVTGIQIAWVDEVLGPVAALPVANSYAEIEDAIADGVQEAA